MREEKDGSEEQDKIKNNRDVKEKRKIGLV